MYKRGVTETLKRLATTLICLMLVCSMTLTASAAKLSDITSDSIKQMEGQISNANDEKEELEDSLKAVKNLVKKL